MDVDPSETEALKAVHIDDVKRFLVRSHHGGWQGAQQRQHLVSPA